MFENGTNIKRLVLFHQQAASAAEPQTHEEILRGDVHAETSGSETGMIQNNKRLQRSCLFSLQTILTSPIISRLCYGTSPVCLVSAFRHRCQDQHGHSIRCKEHPDSLTMLSTPSMRSPFIAKYRFRPVAQPKLNISYILVGISY